MPCEAKDKAQFDQLVKDAGDKLVLVDFHATWCGPCKMISPKLETIEKELPNELVIIKVDVDECEDVAASHGISAMPTFIFYKNGNRLPDCDVVGASEAKIREQINKLK